MMNNKFITALTLSYSVAEYAAPNWARSPHAQKLNTELNSACRVVTGCLKPTNVEDVHLLAGNAPPDEMCVLEWKRPNRKPMRAILYMKSRNCFLRSVKSAELSPKVVSCCLPTPMTLAIGGGGQSDHLVCSPPARFLVHLARSEVSTNPGG